MEQETLSKRELWVRGSLERLVTLGFLHGYPLGVKPDHIDKFLELDDKRFSLFESDEEIVVVLKQVLLIDCMLDGMIIPRGEIESLVYLVLEYKNNRERLVKFALNRSIGIY